MSDKAPVIDACIRGYKPMRAFNVAWDMLVGDPVGLIREPENPHDSCAVVATNADQQIFGYIQAEKAGVLAKWMDAGWVYSARIIQSAITKKSKGMRWIKKDSIWVRCTPIQPIALKKQVTRSRTKQKEHVL